jgi:hypothetical protein
MKPRQVASTLNDGENYPTFDAIEDRKISRVGIGLRAGFAGETSAQRHQRCHEGLC